MIDLCSMQPSLSLREAMLRLSCVWVLLGSQNNTALENTVRSSDGVQQDLVIIFYIMDVCENSMTVVKNIAFFPLDMLMSHNCPAQIGVNDRI
jgi:hypothetical protein